MHDSQIVKSQNMAYNKQIIIKVNVTVKLLLADLSAFTKLLRLNREVIQTLKTAHWVSVET